MSEIKFPKMPIKYWESTVKKWQDGLEKLKLCPDSESWKNWFNDLIAEKCGLCEAVNTKCDKCPAFYTLICNRLQDSKATLWQIWDECCKHNKQNVENKTNELIEKIKQLKVMFE